MIVENHPKYLRRLAEVYMDKYDAKGFPVAREWFDSFLTEELRVRIRPYIKEIVAERERGKNGPDVPA